MVLVLGPALQQQPPVLVINEHRERQVQEARGAMGFKLFGGSRGYTRRVDEDHMFHIGSLRPRAEPEPKFGHSGTVWTKNGHQIAVLERE